MSDIEEVEKENDSALSSSSSGEDDDVVEELEKEASDSTKRTLAEPANPEHLTKKLKRNELYKAPTVDELNNLKEAETLFHSSLFRLQIDELMSEVKFKITPEFQNFIRTVKTFIKNLSPSPDWYELEDKSWIENGVKVPIMRHCKTKNARFKFLPPKELFETGSYAIDALHVYDPVIDLAVVMPLDCWRKGDYLNQAYHIKRALYLTYIAQHLMEEEFIEDLEYAYLDECPLRPTLLIKSKLLNGVYYTIRLLPCSEEGFVKQGKARFHPGLNNIRYSAFYSEKVNDVEGSMIPTPFYNSTVLADIMMSELTKFLKSNITSQSVKGALILTKIWSRQRDLLEGSRTLNGFLISLVMIHLLQKRKISPLMSSYQIFRNFLLFLKNHDLESVVTLCVEKQEKQPEFSDFQKAFDVVFIDPSGFMNLFYDVSKESFRMYQHEANLALKILDSESSDSFFQLFINRVPFRRKFEYLIHICDVKKFSQYVDALNLKQKVLDHVGDLMPAVVPKICEIIGKALGSRIDLMNCSASHLAKWHVTKRFLHPNVKRYLTIGLLVCKETAFINVEKGPPFDGTKAKDFRDFWGDKSELRRFQDGSMHEAVVWPADTIEDQRHVIPQMVKYVLERHAKISPEEIVCRGTDMNFVLNVPKRLFPTGSYGTGEQVFVSLMQSYSALTKELRKLEGLPLVILSIQGLAASFRFSEVYPPLGGYHPFPKSICLEDKGIMRLQVESVKSPSWVPPLPVVIHFEGSGKWPDDKNAIKRVKAAMHLKLGQLLKSQFELICKPTTTHVDVLKDGYVFRLEVACHKEITLLKQFVTAEGMVKMKDNEASKSLEYRTEILPKLNSFLHGLHQQYNSFGTACRLAKRFLASQLLQGYLDDVLIELLMAFVYIRPEPYVCPSMPQVAFQRFLALLSAHNWEANPMIININGELNKQDLEEIQSMFSSQRPTLPPMVVATPMDRNGTLLSKETPSQMMLGRLIAVSKAALEFLETKLIKPRGSGFDEIFIPPLHPYDVLIHLKPGQIPKRCYAIEKLMNTSSSQPKVTKKSSRVERMPVVGYNPVECYLMELRETFGEVAFFFYDNYGGSYIAVLWNRETIKSKPFKVSHINYHKLTRRSANSDEAAIVVPNVEAIITDFTEMGAGLVDNIEKRTDKWNFE